MTYVTTNWLQVGEKDYYLETGRIVTIEKSFGDVITHIVFQNEDEEVVRKLWKHFVSLFRAGEKSKMNDIKKVLEIR